MILIPFRKLALLAWVGMTGALTTGLYRFFPARRVLPDLADEGVDWA